MDVKRQQTIAQKTVLLGITKARTTILEYAPYSQKKGLSFIQRSNGKLDAKRNRNTKKVKIKLNNTEEGRTTYNVFIPEAEEIKIYEGNVNLNLEIKTKLKELGIVSLRDDMGIEDKSSRTLRTVVKKHRREKYLL